MAKAVQVVVNSDRDEEVIQQLAGILRGNASESRQLRDFSDSVSKEQRPNGLRFQPKPGHLLVCRFGLGFEKPENVKTRPVMVISPRQRVWTKLVVVAPISSKPPKEEKPYHYKLPSRLLPGAKYEESWIKGDMVVSVGAHRLDRIKTGFRQYVAPIAPEEVLREVRRCALHACGMHTLTEHW